MAKFHACRCETALFNECTQKMGHIHSRTRSSFLYAFKKQLKKKLKNLYHGRSHERINVSLKDYVHLTFADVISAGSSTYHETRSSLLTLLYNCFSLNWNGKSQVFDKLLVRSIQRFFRTHLRDDFSIWSSNIEKKLITKNKEGHKKGGDKKYEKRDKKDKSPVEYGGEIIDNGDIEENDLAAEKQAKDMLSQVISCSFGTPSCASALKRYIVMLQMQPVYVVCGGYDLKNDSLLSLLNNSELDDHILNSYFTLLQRRSQVSNPLIEVFTTFFLKSLEDDPENEIAENEFDRKPITIWESIVFVPIHHGFPHWSLVRLNFRDGTISFFDSLGLTTHSSISRVKTFFEKKIQGIRKNTNLYTRLMKVKY